MNKADNILPDLPDMMAAGMGITEALAFWNEMMNAPDRSPKLWWDRVKAFPEARPSDQALH